MTKEIVYSWRLDPAMKTSLEDAARQHQTSVANLLEDIVAEWLRTRPGAQGDDEIQARLQAAALQHAGAVRGDDPDRAERASANVRARLKRQRAG